MHVRLLALIAVAIGAGACASAQCTPDWQPVVDATTGASLRGIIAVAEFKGQLIVAGDFDQIGGVAAHNIAAWNGSSWTPLGSGIDGPSASTRVECLLAFSDHGQEKLAVGGLFSTAGGVVASNIACWDGAQWSALGLGGGFTKPGLQGNGVFALSIAEFPGYPGGPLLFAGGNFALLDGVGGHGGCLAFLDLGGAIGWQAPFIHTPNDGPYSGGDGSNVYALAFLHNQLFIGGDFDHWLVDSTEIPANFIAAMTWTPEDGFAFAQVGGTPGDGGGIGATIHTLAPLPIGPGGQDQLVIGADFDPITATCVWRWDGSTNAPLGDGGQFIQDPNDAHNNETVMSLAMFRGQPFACTTVAYRAPAARGRLLRLSDDVWTPVPGTLNRDARSLARVDDALYVGGRFTQAGTQPAGYLARWACKCPADLTDDQSVDLLDFFAFFNAFDTGAAAADLTSDGVVDLLDFFEFFGHFDLNC